MSEDTTNGAITAGIDLGDRYSRFCLLGESGKILEEGRLRTSADAFEVRFGSCRPLRVAIEVGSHSPWVSRLLEQFGHDVIVANASKLRLIYDNNRKNDRVDAEYLARLARVDPKLLSPIRHRSRESQADLAVLRARDALVKIRADLVNYVRGTAKAFGTRLRKSDTRYFHRHASPLIPEPLEAALSPVLEELASITLKIRQLDGVIQQMIDQKYPETKRLLQIHGVGPVTALTYVLTIEDPRKFRCSRTLGAYLGLIPRQKDSGQSQPQLRITKAGDLSLRRLLVNCANYILGPFGKPSDLRSWGLALAQRGGTNRKKQARIAVARKLAVVLHRLWISGEEYEPFRHSESKPRQAATA